MREFHRQGSGNIREIQAALEYFAGFDGLHRRQRFRARLRAHRVARAAGSRDAGGSGRLRGGADDVEPVRGRQFFGGGWRPHRVLPAPMSHVRRCRRGPPICRPICARSAWSADIRPFDGFTTPRAYQLFQRSNQFNLTTIRYSEARAQDYRRGPRLRYVHAAFAGPSGRQRHRGRRGRARGRRGVCASKAGS